MSLLTGRPRSQPLFLPREETERLPARGERSRRPRCKASYCLVHTGPAADRYADRPLPSGTAKISRRRLISVVGDRFQLSMVDFDCQRSIDGEIDRRLSIEEE
ncbi:hypothetical protein BHM03_00007984 [Ensete ventricosum]|nr:hypothetical protein BHM03_00007984 [Ensete ventricosum]